MKAFYLTLLISTLTQIVGGRNVTSANGADAGGAEESVTTKIMSCKSQFPDILSNCVNSAAGGCRYVHQTIGILENFEMSFGYRNKPTKGGRHRLQKLNLTGNLVLMHREKYKNFSTWIGQILFGPANDKDGQSGVLRVNLDDNKFELSPFNLEMIDDKNKKGKPGFVFKGWAIQGAGSGTVTELNTTLAAQGLLQNLWFIDLSPNRNSPDNPVSLTFTGLQGFDPSGIGNDIWVVQANHCTFSNGVDRKFLEKFYRDRSDD